MRFSKDNMPTFLQLSLLLREAIQLRAVLLNCHLRGLESQLLAVISITQISNSEPNWLSVENNLRYFVLFLHKSNQVKPKLVSLDNKEEN